LRNDYSYFSTEKWLYSIKLKIAFCLYIISKFSLWNPFSDSNNFLSLTREEKQKYVWMQPQFESFYIIHYTSVYVFSVVIRNRDSIVKLQVQQVYFPKQS